MLQAEDWHNEGAICRAFNIGKTEAKAVAQLHTGMARETCNQLEEVVRQYGMKAFIFHDVLAKECFSRGFCSATSGMESWGAQLTNGSRDDDPLASGLRFNLRDGADSPMIHALAPAR